MSSEFVDFERESKSYCEVVAVAPPFPRPPLARGTSVPQLVPSGTLVDRWDLGSPAVRLQVEPSQARIGDCAPLQLGSRKGSVGWVESWRGSPREGSPKFGDNLKVSRFGFTPKLQGQCPGDRRPPLGTSQGLRITRSENTVVPCVSHLLSLSLSSLLLSSLILYYLMLS